MSSVLGPIIQTIVATAKKDFGAKVLPLVGDLARSVAVDGTAIGIASALAVFNVGVANTLPELSTDERKALADAILNAIAAEQQTLAPSGAALSNQAPTKT